MIAVITAVAVLLVKVKVYNEETYNVSNLCEDFKKLKLYDYEPLASSSDESDKWVKFQMIPEKGRNHGVNAPNARLCKRNKKVGVVKMVR